MSGTTEDRGERDERTDIERVCDRLIAGILASDVDRENLESAKLDACGEFSSPRVPKNAEIRPTPARTGSVSTVPAGRPASSAPHSRTRERNLPQPVVSRPTTTRTRRSGSVLTSCVISVTLLKRPN